MTQREGAVFGHRQNSDLLTGAECEVPESRRRKSNAAIGAQRATSVMAFCGGRRPERAKNHPTVLDRELEWTGFAAQDLDDPLAVEAHRDAATLVNAPRARREGQLGHAVADRQDLS